MNLKFYTFEQNNVEGYFVIDDKTGVCENIIIQAENIHDAISKLFEIGEKTENFFSFCECCGDRWSPYFVDESDGNKDLIISGNTFVHFYNGTKEKYTING